MKVTFVAVTPEKGTPYIDTYESGVTYPLIVQHRRFEVEISDEDVQERAEELIDDREMLREVNHVPAVLAELEDMIEMVLRGSMSGGTLYQREVFKELRKRAFYQLVDETRAEIRSQL